jgi:hypothetical protein
VLLPGCCPYHNWHWNWNSIVDAVRRNGSFQTAHRTRHDAKTGANSSFGGAIVTVPLSRVR